MVSAYPPRLSPTHSIRGPTLPLELVDRIAHKILYQNELLPLAAANSTFYAIIYSFHLRCREVKCCINDGSMWDWLEENPRRLDGVRFLELHDLPQTYRLPPPSSKDTPLNKRLLPPGLVLRMKGLVSFGWNKPLVPAGLGKLGVSLYEDEIWSSLQLLLRLEHVAARGEGFACGACAKQEGLTVSKMYNLSHLLSFRHEFGCPSSLATDHTYHHLTSMLQQSPQLRSLQLECRGFGRTAGILKGLSLPEIRELHLAGIVLSEPFPVLGSHHTIQQAYLLSTFETTPAQTGNNLLPRLSNCSADHQAALWITQPLLDKSSRPLDTLKILGPLFVENQFEDLNLRPVGDTLRYLDISLLVLAPFKTCWKQVMEELGDMCPALRRLTIGKLDNVQPSEAKTDQTTLESWLAPLSELNNLVALSLPAAIWLSPRTAHSASLAKLGLFPQEFTQASVALLLHSCPKLRLLFGTTENSITLLMNETLLLHDLQTVEHAFLLHEGEVGDTKWSMRRMGASDFGDDLDNLVYRDHP